MRLPGVVCVILMTAATAASCADDVGPGPAQPEATQTAEAATPATETGSRIISADAIEPVAGEGIELITGGSSTDGAARVSRLPVLD